MSIILCEDQRFRYFRASRKEIRKQGIPIGLDNRANLINCDYIAIEMSPLMQKILVSRTPLGRWGQPDEIAATAVFLASDDAAFYTGQWLSPNGGLVIGG